MGARRLLVLTAAAGLLLALIAPAGAQPGAADPPGVEVRAKHAAVEAYWTADRVAAAVPRTLTVDVTKGRAIPLEKGGNGKGNGGGGGDDSGINCNKKSNRDLPECGGTGGDDGGGTGGGGGETGGQPAVSDGENWSLAGYDTTESDVRTLVGKVLFTLGGTDYVCSGSTVTDHDATDGRALVVTAGHCAHEGDGLTWATNWTFIPNFEWDTDGSVRTCDDSPHGCWVADALVTTADWAEVGNLNYDVAFAVVTTGGHTGTQTLEAMLAAQGAAPAAIGFNRTRGEYVAAFGYPQATPYNGTDLIYCANDAIPYHWYVEPILLFSYHQGLACDMTGGSSGGPWYAEFDTATGTGVAMSVNSYKMTGDPNTMYGTYFGNYAQKAYTKARTAVSNATVSPPPVIP